MVKVRHKCFISYHHADQNEVDDFVKTFDHDRDVFIARGLGKEMSEDIIASDNTEYVMRRIREDYLRDSTVTVVLMGKCTWARRYVDWEIQASLRSGTVSTPNGLLGIKLPSYSKSQSSFPPRFSANLNGTDNCYARWIEYPKRSDSLSNSIDYAFDRRSTHSKWIINSRERFIYNRQC